MARKLIFALAIAISITGPASAQNEKPATATQQKAEGAQFNFKDGDTFDFGEITQGPDAIHEFSFTNTGNQPLTIIDAKPSCSCTTPEWPKDAIAPGANGIIKVGYHTTKPGPFVKEIYIQSNAVIPSGERRYTIFIKGVVK
jgi:hypothetical protein